jgi:hypothetical protein
MPPTDENGNGKIKQGELQHAVATLEQRHGPDGMCETRWADMEGRMRKVEAWRWQAIGAMALIQLLGVGLIVEAMKKMLQ